MEGRLVKDSTSYRNGRRMINWFTGEDYHNVKPLHHSNLYHSHIGIILVVAEQQDWSHYLTQIIGRVLANSSQTN